MLKHAKPAFLFFHFFIFFNDALCYVRSLAMCRLVISGLGSNCTVEPRPFHQWMRGSLFAPIGAPCPVCLTL